MACYQVDPNRDEGLGYAGRTTHPTDRPAVTDAVPPELVLSRAAQQAIAPQIELARAVLKSKTPLFGSCWGLQVLTVAALLTLTVLTAAAIVETYLVPIP